MAKSQFKLNTEFICNTDAQGDTYFANVMDSTSSVLRLRGPAALMWQLMMENKAKKDIVKAVTKEYKVGASQVQSDLKVLIKDLENHGILED